MSAKLVKEGFSERFQRELDRQYGLDIWVCGEGKVANLIWNRNELVEIVYFKARVLGGRPSYTLLDAPKEDDLIKGGAQAADASVHSPANGRNGPARLRPN